MPPFDYEVRHRPVKTIGHADGLSQFPPSMNAVAETFQALDSQKFSDIRDSTYSPDISNDTDHGPSYPTNGLTQIYYPLLQTIPDWTKSQAITGKW